jgi:hypothetical protein
MKIIDEKGRLFGKVNLIDLAVVVVLVAVIAAVGMKLFGNKAVEAVTSPAVSITYEVVCEDVPKSVADYCQANVGEQLLSSGKLLNAHIVDCRAEETAEGCDLYFTVEGTCNYAGNTYSMGSQEVRVGMEHLVKTSSIECEGIICALEADHG